VRKKVSSSRVEKRKEKREKRKEKREKRKEKRERRKWKNCCFEELNYHIFQ